MNDLIFTNAGDFLKGQQKRIGFACKYMHPDQTQKKKLLEEVQRPLNTRSTTVAWLNRQTRDVAEERLWDIMVPTLRPYKRLIEYVGSPSQSSLSLVDWVAMCSVYTSHLELLLAQVDVRDYVQRIPKVGETARVPCSIIHATWPTYCTCKRQPRNCRKEHRRI